MNSIRVLCSGIDSLYVSFRGEPNAVVLGALGQAKAHAREGVSRKSFSCPAQPKRLCSRPAGDDTAIGFAAMALMRSLVRALVCRLCTCAF